MGVEAGAVDPYTPAFVAILSPHRWWSMSTSVSLPSARSSSSSSVLLPPDYRPSEKEAFMGPLQLEYFRQKLLK
ncbi:MAG: hypothetical protein FJX52_13120, partial [Alphaproteobacteria bacterium]|nr:hypothetical protein [Alphaproteobacteria bacterium]